MEIRVIEKGKKRMIIELEGIGHSFCNALVEELWNDESVEVAAYNIKHPLIGIPQLIVDTDGKEDPKKALIEAAKRLKKLNAKFKKGFIEEIK